MKKQLLGTTALVAAGMLAAAGSANAQQPTPGKITLQLGGYMNQFFGFSKSSNTGDTLDPVTGTATFPAGTGHRRAAAVDVQSDSEIYFLGKTTLDNGLTVGATIELEVIGSPGAITDEQWAFVEGSWGQVRLGTEDPPVFLMHYAAPDAGLGLSYGYAPYQWVAQPASTNAAARPAGQNAFGAGIVSGYDSPINTTRIRLEDDDSEKIIYYSPRIEGFQFGVSYAPQAVQDSTPATPVTPSRSEFYTDGWSLGLNFVRKFDPVDIALSAGYITWANVPSTVKRVYPDAENPWGFNLGANIGFAGFVFGAAYAEEKDLRWSQISHNTMNGGKSWEVGAQYNFGASSVSLGYFQGWEDGAVGATGTIPSGGHDVQKRWQVGAGHRLGPGVAVKGSLFHVKWEDESLSAFDNDGWGLVGGIFLNF